MKSELKMLATGVCFCALAAFITIAWDKDTLAQRVSEPSVFFGELANPLAVKISESPLTFVPLLGLAIAAEVPEGAQRDAIRGNIFRIYGLIVNDDDELEGLGYDPVQRERIIDALKSIGYANPDALVLDIETNGTLNR